MTAPCQIVDICEPESCEAVDGTNAADVATCTAALDAAVGQNSGSVCFSFHRNHSVLFLFSDETPNDKMGVG
jgi:hypothetical protein